VFHIDLVLGKEIFFDEKLHVNQEFWAKSDYELKSRRNSINRFKSERNYTPELSLWHCEQTADILLFSIPSLSNPLS
jgi:hypothetical protein